MKEESGFTLIELLIVIVILGILAAIVVFSVQGIQDKGKTSACQSDVATSTTAVEAYYAQHGNYPATLSLLVPSLMHSDPSVGTNADVNYTAGTPAGSYTITGIGC